MVNLVCLKPIFGQTYPELIAIGWQAIFNSSYILPTPFLKGGLSLGGTLVAWGKIIIGRFVELIIFNIWSKKT